MHKNQKLSAVGILYFCSVALVVGALLCSGYMFGKSYFDLLMMASNQELVSLTNETIVNTFINIAMYSIIFLTLPLFYRFFRYLCFVDEAETSRKFSEFSLFTIKALLKIYGVVTVIAVISSFAS